MKKKILAIVLCIAMLAIAIVGGTMAYFTDKDAATNVFVSGNVSITQYEHTIDENGKFVELSAEAASNMKLLPMIHLGTGEYPTADEQWVTSDYYTALDNEDETDEARATRTTSIWDEPNVVDKFVSVYNDGTNDVYVRTIIASPYALADKLILGLCIPGITWECETLDDHITVDGVEYEITVMTYMRGDGILEPNKSTGPSLQQVALQSDTTNEDLEGLADGFKILVASQAVQADGFTEAAVAKGLTVEKNTATIPTMALDAAFGAITSTNHPWAE